MYWDALGKNKVGHYYHCRVPCTISHKISMKMYVKYARRVNQVTLSCTYRLMLDMKLWSLSNQCNL